MISTFIFSSFLTGSSRPDSCMERDDLTPCWATGGDSTNCSGLFSSLFNSFFWPSLLPRCDFKKATKLGSASIDKETDRDVTKSQNTSYAFSSCYLCFSLFYVSSFSYQLSLLFKPRHFTALWPLRHISWVQLTGEETPEKELINVFQGKATTKILYSQLTN